VALDIGAAQRSGNGSQYNLAGEVALGYSSKSWGLRASGSTIDYDLSTPNRLEAATGFGGSIEGWWRSQGAGFAVDLRIAASGSNLDSALSSPAGATRFAAWTNETAYGSGLAGVTWQGERASLGAWAGASAQYELYEPVVVTTVVTLQQQQQFTAAEQARVRAAIELVPRVLFGRVRGDLFAHQVTHTTATIVAGGGGTAQSFAASTDSEIDARVRAFVGLSLLSFLSIVPGLTGGFDYVARSGSGGATPFFGVGLDGDSQ
jgi:hypothetical protein